MHYRNKNLSLEPRPWNYPNAAHMETIRQHQQGGKLHPSGFSACGNRGPSIWNVPISSLYQNKYIEGGRCQIILTQTKLLRILKDPLETTVYLAYRASAMVSCSLLTPAMDSYIINVKHADLKLKCPYYGLWRVHIWFWSAQQQVDMHARSKTLSFSYSIHLFWRFLPNDSQTIRSTIYFPNPSFAWR